MKMMTHRNRSSLKPCLFFFALSFVASTFAESSVTSNAASAASPYADMPLTLTSFGATRVANTVYVYGGHTGEAHHYSTEEQSNKLLSLDLSKPNSPWQELSEGTRLQGLALVAHGRKLIRVGGFEAKNKLDEEHVLKSTNEVLAYDIDQKTWSALPSLPEPRSSHDAIVLGDRLYVVGGWTLDGEETRWLTTAWSIALPAEGKSWEAVAMPPFARRAVALATLDDRVYVVGGMNEKGGPTTEVAFFDESDSAWNTAPALKGRTMNGFGASAWPVRNVLIATTIDGDIQRLALDGKEWEMIGKTRDARFFHRLIPLGNDQLIAVGGANMESGKFPNVEVITIP